MDPARKAIIRSKVNQAPKLDASVKKGCVHFDLIQEIEPSSDNACEQCVTLGDSWVNLRLCMTCGQVGCCDDSKNRHARKHYQEADHPVIMSFQPREDWLWCYADDVLVF
ncbi:MAG: UBP-type zinc finger domain-containing protein [Chloroflexi bacterium]|nr:UBP-type zinc finger domain-containing protein [Chloroflexota bacterium]